MAQPMTAGLQGRREYHGTFQKKGSWSYKASSDTEAATTVEKLSDATLPYHNVSKLTESTVNH